MDDSWPASPRAEELSDSISSHAAEVERTLRALEAVEAFRAEAAALRAELHATRGPQYQRPAFRRVPAPELPASTWRLILEAGFLVGIALVCWAVHLRRIEIVLVMAAAWAVVAVLEAIAWRRAEGVYRVGPPPAISHPVLEPVAAPLPVPEPEPAGEPDWPGRDEAAHLTSVLPAVRLPADASPERKRRGRGRSGPPWTSRWPAPESSAGRAPSASGRAWSPLGGRRPGSARLRCQFSRVASRTTAGGVARSGHEPHPVSQRSQPGGQAQCPVVGA